MLRYKIAPKCLLPGPFGHSDVGWNPGVAGTVRSYNLVFTYPCQGRRGAHRAASGRRTPGFRIDVRIGVHGVVHLLVMGLRRQGRRRSGNHRPVWLRAAFLRPRQPRTVRQRCGAAHPHVEAPQGWTDMHRPRRPFRFAGLLCRREPLPGQCPAVHPVPAGRTVPSILQAGMHQIT